MKITFLGTGVGIPQAGRVQSGLIMEIGGKAVLFDCGCGVLARVQESGYLHTDIENIFLTHLHLDHVGDVLALLKANWLVGKTNMRMFGPTGTKEWFEKTISIYEYLQGRIEVEIIELEAGASFTPEGLDCVIKTAPGVHSITSLAYRVEHSGKTVVYAGDTEPCIPVFELAEGADILIHECSFPLNFEMTNHTTPDMFSRQLKETPLNVKQLYLVHLYPHMQGHESEALEHIKEHFKGDVKIATDLLEIEL
jgi:ribonuclease BN (tRNA processing enzyme)